MPKKSHTTNTPSAHFLFCLNGSCAHRKECLRALGVDLVGEREAIRALNPSHYSSGADEECAYFKPCTMQRLGWGIKTLLGNLRYNQSQQLREALKAHYPYATFYRMLDGKVPFCPADQQFVADTMRNLGLSDELVFDRYTEVFVWE